MAEFSTKKNIDFDSLHMIASDFRVLPVKDFLFKNNCGHGSVSDNFIPNLRVIKGRSRSEVKMEICAAKLRLVDVNITSSGTMSSALSFDEKNKTEKGKEADLCIVLFFVTKRQSTTVTCKFILINR